MIEETLCSNMYRPVVSTVRWKKERWKQFALYDTFWVIKESNRIYVYFGSYLHKVSLERYIRNLIRQVNCWRGSRNEEDGQRWKQDISLQSYKLFWFLNHLNIWLVQNMSLRLPWRQLENERRGLGIWTQIPFLQVWCSCIFCYQKMLMEGFQTRSRTHDFSSNDP